MKTLMGLAGLTMAGFMLLSCNTEVKEANYQIIPLPQEISVMIRMLRLFCQMELR